MVKRRKGKKKAWDPVKKAQNAQKRKVRSVFLRMGFARISADNIEFTFDGRTGELDDLFVFENIIVICEYTVGGASTSHVAAKSILIRKILSDTEGWLLEYSRMNKVLATFLESSSYALDEFRSRYVYVSNGASAEVEGAFSEYRFLDGNRLRYFDSLSKTILRSSRFEFLKYLEVPFCDVAERVRGSKSVRHVYSGQILPEPNSGYPNGVKVVSFYADPKSLIQLSYVLRKDSWRDNEGLYQRILIKSKIHKMRKYLAGEKRVFVNNIIVTLPPETELSPPGRRVGVSDSALRSVGAIDVSVPFEANVIGLVDGQHRVFCYHEGRDRYEAEISKARERQNLLVTGLVFPPSWDAVERRTYEAKLFLEINDNQAKAKSNLKQSIELILHPYSTVAIAKDITDALAVRGPLKDMLQVSYFDPPEKIKTTSIVSYGLQPLVKFEGADSLFSVWRHPDKEYVKDGRIAEARRRPARDEYVKYCVETISTFILAVREGVGHSRWKLEAGKRKKLVSPTLINGLLVCMRRLVEEGKIERKSERYARRLQGVDAFPFDRYKSSGWRKLGDDLFDRFFS